MTRLANTAKPQPLKESSKKRGNKEILLKIKCQAFQYAYFRELSFWYSHLLLGPGCGCDLAGEEAGCLADAVVAWLSEATDAILQWPPTSLTHCYTYSIWLVFVYTLCSSRMHLCKNFFFWPLKKSSLRKSRLLSSPGTHFRRSFQRQILYLASGF